MKKLNFLNKIIMASIVIIFISACGEESHWGIDDQNTSSIKAVDSQVLINIPFCEKDSMDAVEAGVIILDSVSHIKRIEENSSVRIWHFQNGLKAVCTLTGQAVIQNNIEKEDENESL